MFILQRKTLVPFTIINTTLVPFTIINTKAAQQELHVSVSTVSMGLKRTQTYVLRKV
jgi:hypothetical protein